VTFKKRPGKNRRYLFILMAIMVLQIIPFYGEFTIAFLYVRKRFQWEVEEYSQYSSIVSAIGIVGSTPVSVLCSPMRGDQTSL
jgi:hypothetical protein